MAVITKDLGAATAYAYAVSKGYTGTEEEFATEIANGATYAQNAAESATAAETAQGKAEDAQDAAEDAAESISSSAAQIATNTSDISELKSALNTVEQALDYSDLKNAFDGNLYNGYWTQFGNRTSYNGDVCPYDQIECPENASVVVIGHTAVTGITYFISYFDAAGTTRLRRDTGSGTSYTGKSPRGTKYVTFTFEKTGSLTKDDISALSLPSKSTAVIATGSISGLSFIRYGVPIASFHESDTASIEVRISTVAVFMSVPSLNSMMSME